jgi:hypothetical protein
MAKAHILDLGEKIVARMAKLKREIKGQNAGTNSRESGLRRAKAR